MLAQDVRSAAKTQYVHAQAIEKVAPSVHPEGRVLSAPRPQQPILDATQRWKLLQPRGNGNGEASPKGLRGARLPPKGNLRERVVLRSFLPDQLKMECLERLDKMEKDQAEREEAKLREREGGESQSDKRRRSLSKEKEIPGGFHKDQQVVARRDLYLEGDTIMAMYMDKAVVLGPSRSSDPNRVCVQFEERRDGGTMWVNVMPDEIMSEENGKLMQSILLKAGKARRRASLRTLLVEEEGPDALMLLSPNSRPASSEGDLQKPRVWTWTSSARQPRGALTWTGAARGASQTSRMQETTSKMLRDSQSLPALLGGVRLSPRLALGM
mmetsp:Transcript_39496/g.91304  ORF Transcript_39496/g.91304 Transcript_39496/m.91304 type:complete len:326 (-) Transcript_39496:32-1009(-)